MNLKSLSDSVLLENTKKVVGQEREILTTVLHHLLEIERRRLFASSKVRCASLFEYATKGLGYSADEAVRRISAMRLLKALPEVEEKIQDGKVNLTNLNMAQTLFRKEEQADAGFSKHEKIEILEKLENKTTKEAGQIIFSYSSQPAVIVKEKIRHVANDVFEVKFAISEETQAKIENIKGLLAHTDPNVCLGKLFDKLCDLGLEQWDPAKKKVREKKTKVPVSKQVLSDTAGELVPEISFRKVKSNSKVLPASVSRYVPAAVQRELWMRAKSRCENCGSTFALEIDHRQPRSLGGSSETQNLRLLCRACNQRAAIEAFGVDQMALYLDWSIDQI